MCQAGVSVLYGFLAHLILFTTEPERPVPCFPHLQMRERGMERACHLHMCVADLGSRRQGSAGVFAFTSM